MRQHTYFGFKFFLSLSTNIIGIRMVKSLESLGNTNEDQVIVTNGSFEPATFPLLARRFT